MPNNDGSLADQIYSDVWDRKTKGIFDMNYWHDLNKVKNLLAANEKSFSSANYVPKSAFIDPKEKFLPGGQYPDPVTLVAKYGPPDSKQIIDNAVKNGISIEEDKELLGRAKMLYDSQRNLAKIGGYADMFAPTNTESNLRDIIMKTQAAPVAAQAQGVVPNTYRTY